MGQPITDGAKLLVELGRSGTGQAKLELGRAVLRNAMSAGRRATSEEVYAALDASPSVMEATLKKARALIDTGELPRELANGGPLSIEQMMMVGFNEPTIDRDEARQVDRELDEMLRRPAVVITPVPPTAPVMTPVQPTVPIAAPPGGDTGQGTVTITEPPSAPEGSPSLNPDGSPAPAGEPTDGAPPDVDIPTVPPPHRQRPDPAPPANVPQAPGVTPAKNVGGNAPTGPQPPRGKNR